MVIRAGIFPWLYSTEATHLWWPQPVMNTHSCTAVGHARALRGNNVGLGTEFYLLSANMTMTLSIPEFRLLQMKNGVLSSALSTLQSHWINEKS